MHDQIYTVEAMIEVPDIVVEIRNYSYPSPFEGCTERSQHTLSMALSPRMSYSQCAYRNADHAMGPWVDVGDVMFAPVGVVMFSRGVGGAHRRLCCNFSSDLFNKVTQFRDPWSEQALIACLNVPGTTIKRDLYRLAGEVAEPNFNNETLVAAVGNILLVELARYLRRPQQTQLLTQGKLAAWQLRRITDYVESSIEPSPTVEQLAKLCELSSRHLGRAFKETMGQTIGDYIKEVRLIKAKSLLADTHLGLKEIAYRLGFSSPSSFCVAFGKASGMTPKQFRLERK
ncbi:MAG TPA: AraC family transcriptional regulator [Spongiibacteraceae bacterium]|nr:AraC family transcriptional regulator [Spongiibacteraceae bacterium]